MLFIFEYLIWWPGYLGTDDIVANEQHPIITAILKVTRCLEYSELALYKVDLFFFCHFCDSCFFTSLLWFSTLGDDYVMEIIVNRQLAVYP